MVFALWGFAITAKSERRRDLVVAGLSMGMAFLCKQQALPLLVVLCAAAGFRPPTRAVDGVAAPVSLWQRLVAVLNRRPRDDRAVRAHGARDRRLGELRRLLVSDGQLREQVHQYCPVSVGPTLDEKSVALLQQPLVVFGAIGLLLLPVLRGLSGAGRVGVFAWSSLQPRPRRWDCNSARTTSSS